MSFCRKALIVCLILFSSFQNLFGQRLHNIDSLLSTLKKAKSDTAKFEIQFQIVSYYENNGEYLRCQDFINKANFIAKKQKSKRLELRVLLAQGGLFLKQGSYAKSIKAFFKALKIARIIDDKQAEGRLLDQIGIVYWYEGELNKGLGYLLEAYAIAEENGDFNAMSGVLNNMGLIYRKQGDYEKAEKYYTRSAELCRKLNKQAGLADVLNNIGIIHQFNADFEKAIKFYNESLNIREKLDDKIGITTSLENLGTAYIAMKNNREGEKYLFRALEISESIGDLEGIRGISSNLSDLYLANSDGVKALEYYKKYIEAKEKLDNAIIQKETYQQELAYNYEKEKLNNKKEQEKRNIKAEALRKKQKVIIYASLGVLALVIIFSIFLFNRFQITKRQKKLIELQKKEVEAKNHEIIDSINYAKRLQDAILPPEKLFFDHFKEAFVMYRPKDIIAGDFYFLETNKDLVIFGVADCTGHGVPGALVSVVCSNALHRAIKEFNITDAGQILDKVRELVLQTFEKSVSEVKDGMDISFCVYNSKTKTLNWAGANNPLWISRNQKASASTTPTGENNEGVKSEIENQNIEEIKADKQAIGYIEKPKPFTSHEISLNEGDKIYLFSDGFPDQFGGPDGKKFMYRNFQRKLEAISNLDMQKQHEALVNLFSDWLNRKGGANVKPMEQTDDVCIIGVKI